MARFLLVTFMICLVACLALGRSWGPGIEDHGWDNDVDDEGWGGDDSWENDEDSNPDARWLGFGGLGYGLGGYGLGYGGLGLGYGGLGFGGLGLGGFGLFDEADETAKPSKTSVIHKHKTSTWPKESSSLKDVIE